MLLRLHVLLQSSRHAVFQLRQIPLCVQCLIIHLRLPQLLCDLLRPAKRVLFLLHGLQPFSQHGIERGFAARERFELLDRQSQRAQEFDAQQRVSVGLRIIPVSIFRPPRRDQPLGFVVPDVRPRQAGQRLDLTNGHMHPSCRHCSVSSGFTVKSFFQNNRILISCKRESGLAGRT